MNLQLSLTANKKHLQEILRDLTERKEQLEISVDHENERDTTEKVNGYIDREKARRHLERVDADISQVEKALDRFEKGTYGLCDNCGHPIDPARLEAIPQATLCLSCQAVAQKKS